MSSEQRFAGVERLYGRGALTRFAQAHVIVVGLGGVGSWAAEALARSGIGRLTLVDADEVCVSNTNRQSHAHTGNYGKPKVDAVAARLGLIAPALRVEPVPRFLTPGSMDELLVPDADFVLDACDAFRVKVEAIAHCRRKRIPIVVSGSAGGRIDPTQVRVRDLAKTTHDVLLGQIRRKLREEFAFTRNPQRYFGVPAVYSLEQVRYPQADGTVCARRPADREAAARLDCGIGLGAAVHLTATFGMVAAGVVLERLLQRHRTDRRCAGS